MYFMKKIIKNLRFLFMPSYWIMNNQYDKRVDTLINDLMDVYYFASVGTHTAKLGDVTIWITHHPYASFCIHNVPELENLRPSRLTIYRAKRKLINDTKPTPKISPIDVAILDIRKENF